MALCEQCRAELTDPAMARDPLPNPPFDPTRGEVLGRHLTPLQWRLLKLYWRRRAGDPVSVDTAMHLLYADKIDDPPDDQIIAVMVSHIKKVLDYTCWTITTYPGAYRMMERGLLDPRAPAVADGRPDDGVSPPPERHGPGRGGRDLYGLLDMQPGQSRRLLDPGRLQAARSACYWARKRGLGKFVAGLDAEGAARIWRIE
jgi:hypothetical protein